MTLERQPVRERERERKRDKNQTDCLRREVKTCLEMSKWIINS